MPADIQKRGRTLIPKRTYLCTKEDVPLYQRGRTFVPVRSASPTVGTGPVPARLPVRANSCIFFLPVSVLEGIGLPHLFLAPPAASFSRGVFLSESFVLSAFFSIFAPIIPKTIANARPLRDQQQTENRPVPPCLALWYKLLNSKNKKNEIRRNRKDCIYHFSHS